MKISKVARNFIETEHGRIAFPVQSRAFAANIVPPYTVLSARGGEWQDRKRRWLSFGIKSELGRDDELMFNKGDTDVGQRIALVGLGTSVFDPVLCELLYQWFSPYGGQVVDPFAGGSVRGIVAYILGRKYWGCDLSESQISENVSQASMICPGALAGGGIEWNVGDALESLTASPAADFIFSCPPYGDLESYSDDPADLSTMSSVDFARAYERIILLACSRLRKHRFAAWVVGNYRAPDGALYDFAGLTIRAFQAAGLSFYNDLILATSVGSVPLRNPRAWAVSRKAGRVHQQVLIFVKGDPRLATEAIARAGETSDAH